MNDQRAASGSRITIPSARPLASRVSAWPWLSGAAIAGLTALALTATTPAAAAAATSGEVAAQPAPGALALAVRAAEQRTGGRGTKVDMGVEMGVAVYKVETVSTEGVFAVVIEAASGTVQKVKEPKGARPASNDADGGKPAKPPKPSAALARLEAVSLGLADAINLAEAQTGGQAIQADVDSKDGRTMFDVRLVKDGARQKVLVDATTSAVVTPRRQ